MNQNEIIDFKMIYHDKLEILFLCLIVDKKLYDECFWYNSDHFYNQNLKYIYEYSYTLRFTYLTYENP